MRAEKYEKTSPHRITNHVRLNQYFFGVDSSKKRLINKQNHRKILSHYMLGNARKNKPVQIKSREKSLRPFIFRWSNQIPLDPLSKC